MILTTESHNYNILEKAEQYTQSLTTFIALPHL